MKPITVEQFVSFIQAKSKTTSASPDEQRGKLDKNPVIAEGRLFEIILPAS